jgi:GntR family transcriptional regulator of arabinose operon
MSYHCKKSCQAAFARRGEMKDSENLKHRHIIEALKSEIAEGKYDDGRRLPSELELSRTFKVSRPTAARALQALYEQDLVVRRPGAGTFLTPPSTSNGQRNRTFGLLVPGLGNTEILDPICNAITRFGQASGTTVLWGDAANPVSTVEEAELLCRQFIERGVSGVFFAPLEVVRDREEVNKRVVEILIKEDIAVVLLDRDILDFPERSGYDLIGIDNFYAGYILAEHLAGIGHKRLMCFGRPNYPSTTDLRFAGAREAARKHKLIICPEQICEPQHIGKVKQIIKRHQPEAILCSNDRTAALLIQTLLSLGINVPKEIAVVGFDDLTYATLLSVPLTTIHQPCRDIGHTAVRIMNERIESPTLPARQILLPVELIVRNSCGSSAKN